MRSRFKHNLAGLSPRTGKCHKPFVPTKVGSYILQRCPNCGEGVPIGEKIEGAAVFSVDVQRTISPKEKI
jgi:hypothetical protein